MKFQGFSLAFLRGRISFRYRVKSLLHTITSPTLNPGVSLYLIPTLLRSAVGLFCHITLSRNNIPKGYSTFFFAVGSMVLSTKNNSENRESFYFHLVVYRVFSHDVTAVILVSQNNETAAMLVSQTSPLGGELFSYANAFFRSNKFA